MESPLMAIQAVIMEYAEIMARVSGVQVEILDADVLRLAGTGAYAQGIGQRQADRSHVSMRALRENRTIVVTEPAGDPACEHCVHRANCPDKLIMAAPIRLGRQAQGVITIFASNEAERRHLLASLSLYQSFLEQLADFIGCKATDQQAAALIGQSNEILTCLTDYVDQCMLVLNEDDTIRLLNAQSRLCLGLGCEALGERVRVTQTGDSIHGAQEYEIEVGSRSFHIVGDLYSLHHEPQAPIKIMIFKEQRQFRQSISALSGEARPAMEGICGHSQAMQSLRAQIARIANSPSAVLITGESGTGKELVATAIWRESQRRGQNFVPLNCAAIPEALLESELFGYVRGAFTGASSQGRIGKFELANGGVLLLDEIGDMPLYLQTKLLRVLQERKFTRIGSNHEISVDIRLIASTNQDLPKMIAENRFRGDLYYRLNVIPIHVPPLRERTEDIDELAYLFLRRCSQRFGKPIRHIEPATLRSLRRHAWPGNVRELENAIEYAVNMMGEDGVISPQLLPPDVLAAPEVQAAASSAPGAQAAIVPLRVLENREIRRAVALCGDSTEGKREAARLLGISLSTLYRRLDEEA